MLFLRKLKTILVKSKNAKYRKGYFDGYTDGYEDGFFRKCDCCNLKKSAISEPTTSATTWEQIYSDESY